MRTRGQWRRLLGVLARTWTVDVSRAIADDTRQLAAMERAKVEGQSLEARVSRLEVEQRETNRVLDMLTDLPAPGG